MTSDEISLAIDAKAKQIIQTSETLNTIQAEQSNTKKRLVELSESVRQAKFLLSKQRLEKEILEREYWRSK